MVEDRHANRVGVLEAENTGRRKCQKKKKKKRILIVQPPWRSTVTICESLKSLSSPILHQQAEVELEFFFVGV